MRVDKLGSIPALIDVKVKGKYDYKDVLWPNENPFQDEIGALCRNCDSVEKMYELEKKGANFTKKISDGSSSPLRIAVSFGQIGALKYFTDKKFDLKQAFHKNPLFLML